MYVITHMYIYSYMYVYTYIYMRIYVYIYVSVQVFVCMCIQYISYTLLYILLYIVSTLTYGYIQTIYNRVVRYKYMMYIFIISTNTTTIYIYTCRDIYIYTHISTVYMSYYRAALSLTAQIYILETNNTEMMNSIHSYIYSEGLTQQLNWESYHIGYIVQYTGRFSRSIINILYCY